MDAPEAFADETTIELTEVVKDDDPEERHRGLKEEVSRIGGDIQEHRTIEGHTLAKVDVSNERYVITCALGGIETKESIAAIREGVHVVLKGQETGFHILGGDWMNHVHPFVSEMAYSTIENADQFFGLSNNLERHASKGESGKTRRQEGNVNTVTS